MFIRNIILAYLFINFKKNRRMKKFLYSLFFVFTLLLGVKSAHAQVTIGSSDAPEPGAVLELKSSNLGFLPSRVALSRQSSPDPLPAHIKGMVVFNTTDSPVDTLRTGLYYNTGAQWICLATVPYSMENWFYMPSIVFDVSQTGTGFEKNLYQEYKDQLNSSSGIAKSVGAPDTALSVIPAATDLYYYVIAYDDTVFNNISIDANGMMTYDIIGAATDATLINIVFVEK